MLLSLSTAPAKKRATAIYGWRKQLGEGKLESGRASDARTKATIWNGDESVRESVRTSACELRRTSKLAGARTNSGERASSRTSACKLRRTSKFAREHVRARGCAGGGGLWSEWSAIGIISTGNGRSCEGAFILDLISDELKNKNDAAFFFLISSSLLY